MMKLITNLMINPARTTQQIKSFLQQTLQPYPQKRVVIAVSGGLDSAVCLTLLVRSLGTKRLVPIILPYRHQDMGQAQLIVRWNKVNFNQVKELNIDKPVAQLAAMRRINLPTKNQSATSAHSLAAVRLGNIMARVRMILIYDWAKTINGLVCGTENKSEHYLGYFTRFGDGASDLEPIRHLYKTQVRALAQFLHLPPIFLSQAPSAGLWVGQTDEKDLGFSYAVADQVLAQLIDEQRPPRQISLADVDKEMINRVVKRVREQTFKRQVPYLVP